MQLKEINERLLAGRKMYKIGNGQANSEFDTSETNSLGALSNLTGTWESVDKGWN